MKKNWWNFENRKIKDNFAHRVRTSDDIAKWMSPLDLACQNSLEITFIDFLIEG